MTNELMISRTLAMGREGREESGFPDNCILRIALTCYCAFNVWLGKRRQGVEHGA